MQKAISTTSTPSTQTAQTAQTALPIEQTAKRSQTRFRGVWAYVLIVVLALPLLLWNLDSSPAPWFDEGFTTHAARTWIEHGVYGTYNSTQGFVSFDSGVSTGPTLVIPIAFAFKLLGYGMWQARLVSVVFTLVLLCGLYALISRMHGRSLALLAVLGLLAWPNFGGVGFIQITRQVLGETPALAFLVLGWVALFKSWSARSLRLAALAGLLFGLGLVTKSQVAIVFLPAFGLITLLRWPTVRKDRQQFVRWLMPLAVTMMVLVAWRMVEYIGQLGASAEVQQANAAGYRLSIQLQLLPFSLGRLLTASGWGFVAIMLIGGAASLWRAKAWQLLKPNQPEQAYEEAALGLFALFYGLWYGFVSIGWARYGFVGYVVGIVLCAKWTKDAASWLMVRLPQRLRPAQSQNVIYIVAVMAVAGLWLTAGTSLAILKVDAGAQQTAAYIRAHIPRNAVIETWEWELDAISDHWEIHHPPEVDDFEAVRQLFFLKKRPQLNYDILSANPDYLIAGTMSDYTNVYEEEAVKAHFQQVAAFGSYRVYQRVRSK